MKITFLLILTINVCSSFIVQKKYSPGLFNHVIKNLNPRNLTITEVQQEEFNNGDLIFQTSKSPQSNAIQLATKSKYSHCGIIYKIDGNFIVFEASSKVKKTPIKEWIKNGKDHIYVVKRLKNASEILTSATLEKMKLISNKFNGKNYDSTFEWTDKKIYCSELIWKIYYQATGIQIGKLKKLKDFDLTSLKVKQIMAKRYGVKIPLNNTVISPDDIFKSELLFTVKGK